MASIELTKDNFDAEVLQSDKPVLVDFWADWCGPCKMLSPVVEQIGDELSDVKVGKVDVDANQELATEYKTMSIPTLILFKDGKEIKRSVGVVPKQEIIAMLD